MQTTNLTPKHSLAPPINGLPYSHPILQKHFMLPKHIDTGMQPWEISSYHQDTRTSCSDCIQYRPRILMILESWGSIHLIQPTQSRRKSLTGTAEILPWNAKDKLQLRPRYSSNFPRDQLKSSKLGRKILNKITTQLLYDDGKFVSSRRKFKRKKFLRVREMLSMNYCDFQVI